MTPSVVNVIATVQWTMRCTAVKRSISRPVGAPWTVIGPRNK